MLRYPRKWADHHGMLHDRVEIAEAIGFVEHFQSYQFGSLLELEHYKDEYPAGYERDADIERELQTRFTHVVGWLQTLQQEGQQTISTRKVISKIETETDFEVVLK